MCQKKYNKRKITQLEVMVEEAESSAAAKFEVQLEKEQVSKYNLFSQLV